MPEAAAAAASTGGGETGQAGSAAAGSVTPSAGTALSSVPAGPDWANSFKSDDVKSYVTQKGFKTAEDLATSYQNLEKQFSSGIRLPEKIGDSDAKTIFERLGTPKEAKGYELPREQNSDPKFMEWAETAFHKNSLTKTQAQGVVKAFNEWSQGNMTQYMTERTNAIKQADEKLKSEWGAAYDANVNIAKQGAKVLGLDSKQLDIMEGLLGREALYKKMQEVGKAMGESEFINGQGGAGASKTPEEAQAEIQSLMRDQKFMKKFNRGDKEAIDHWTNLNKLAAPGEKQIG